MTHTKKNLPGGFGLGRDPRIVSEMALPARRRSSRCSFPICPRALFPFPLSADGFCGDFLPLTFQGGCSLRAGFPPVAFQGNLGGRRRCLWPPRI